jgi:hypothetical protein
MRRSLHQQLRALERKKVSIESQIGNSEKESKPLQEMRDQWRRGECAFYRPVTSHYAAAAALCITNLRRCMARAYAEML